VSLWLLTGPPGVGKTTALRRVCGALQGWPLRGFWTEEVRVGGARQGFRLVTFDDEQRTIADVRRPGPPRVGKYGVDVAAIDAVARRVLVPDPAVQLFVVDEIGKMECLSQGFVDAVRTLLAQTRPLLATVALRGEGLIEEVKRDPRARLMHLRRDNRDRLPEEITRILRQALA
jgi:nucleoside-triphosphatase